MQLKANLTDLQPANPSFTQLLLRHIPCESLCSGLKSQRDVLDVSPGLQELPVKLRRQVRAKTICTQWEKMLGRHAVSQGSVSIEWWVGTGAKRPQLPFWHSAHRENTP